MRPVRTYLFEYIDKDGETRYMKIEATTLSYAMQSWEMEKPPEAMAQNIYLQQ